jgi:enoyl-CoA hydratase/carnithine racemase
VERRVQIVLIGINRPQMFNRIDPDTFYGLAKAHYDFDNDSTLRAAVLFGHGDNFSRGNYVEAFSALAKAGGLSSWVKVKSILSGGRKGCQSHLSSWCTIANRIAACGPLGIRARLKVAHLGINDSSDSAAFAALEKEYVSLFKSEDFAEGRKAEAENRPPIFHGR